MVLIASVAVSPTPRIVEALDVLESEFASGNVGAGLLDHAVMIDQRFGYLAIKRRFRQVAEADFPRTPFPACVVQSGVKFRFGIRFCFFGHCDTFYSICGALSSSIAKAGTLVGRESPSRRVSQESLSSSGRVKPLLQK
jgi:hypothetical protein